MVTKILALANQGIIEQFFSSVHQGIAEQIVASSD
jgi:hypothetical protein